MGGPLPLAGKTIVVTRPREQAAELMDALQSLGATPLCFPLLEIGPAADPVPLAQAAQVLSSYQFAIFVSPNAVRYALPQLLKQSPWPEGLQAVAVGPSTVRALAEGGISPCLYPQERFDSEALLELPELAAGKIRGSRFALFRGNGGRELLGDTLEARGARVDRIPCYHRSGPGAGQAEFFQQLDQGSVDALLLTSSESLGHLLELAPEAPRRERLLALPLFVPHARIAAKAQGSGFQEVHLTGPADAGLLAGLCAYNHPDHE